MATAVKDMKTIVLPDRDEMLERLLEVNNERHLVDDFYPLLTKHAGRTVAGIGVCNLINLAIYDYCMDKPPQLNAAMLLLFECFVRALINDDEVLNDALAFLAAVNDKIKAENEKKRAEANPVRLTEEEARSLYAQARHVAEAFDRHVHKLGRSKGHRMGGANPYYNQTANGLFLEYYYSTPSELWTPWGKWHFAAEQLDNIDLDAFIAELTLEVHMPVRHTTEGTFGPVYKILAVEGQELPTPTLHPDQHHYMTYDESKAIWDALTEDYFAHHPYPPNG